MSTSENFTIYRQDFELNLKSIAPKFTAAAELLCFKNFSITVVTVISNPSFGIASSSKTIAYGASVDKNCSIAFYGLNSSRLTGLETTSICFLQRLSSEKASISNNLPSTAEILSMLRFVLLKAVLNSSNRFVLESRLMT